MPSVFLLESTFLPKKVHKKTKISVHTRLIFPPSIQKILQGVPVCQPIYLGNRNEILHSKLIYKYSNKFLQKCWQICCKQLSNDVGVGHRNDLLALHTYMHQYWTDFSTISNFSVSTGKALLQYTFKMKVSRNTHAFS